MGAAYEVALHVWGLLDAGQSEQAAQLFNPDATFTSRGYPIASFEEARRNWEGTRTAFPDLRREITGTVESDDAVAIEIRVHGTNTGPLESTAGQTLPPTGKEVSWAGCDVVRLRGGKIQSWTNYNDQLTLLQMLGLLG